MSKTIQKEDILILAKSNPPETLEEHTENCLNVFSSIRKAMPYLPDIAGEPAFFRHLYYAIALHDLGKAAPGFQEQLASGKIWGYRHEILSAGFVWLLEDLTEFDRQGIALAIISHHKSIREIQERFSTKLSEGKRLFLENVCGLELQLSSLNKFLSQLPKWAKAYLKQDSARPKLLESKGEIEDAYSKAILPFLNSWQDYERNALHGVYGMLLRGLLVSCDHLSSGGRYSINLGIQNVASQLKLPQFRPFQECLTKVNGSTFLMAPTGSGKTEASLLWADANRKYGERIFYVLPYTASINAMSERLSRLFGEDQVGMLHGKARYFIYRALIEKNYTPEEAAIEAKELVQLSRKIYRPLKVLTPFQILKAFFGVKGWESQLAEMAHALFIFDEIHVYEPHTTALILTSIQKLAELNAHFLFMSATFPTFLRNKIHEILPNVSQHFLSENEDGDRTLLHQIRHKIILTQGEITDHLERVVEDLSNGKKVLVVCNTVKRAQSVYRYLKSNFENTALLHGRFILRDREKIERELDNVQLLVGTQAVEVSLDVDFDTLYTEPAPIDALLQRFGRVNRRGKKGVVPVYVFTVGSEKDYYFYDRERVERTISSMADVDELTEKQAVKLVEEVYANGYNGKEQQQFDLAKQSFERVIDNLMPFNESEDDEEFEKLIRSIEVVPECFEQDYIECLENREFFEALRYLATISFGQEMRLLKLEGLKFRKYKTEYGRIFSYPVAFVKYDQDLGLLLDEIENKGVIID